MTLLTRTVSKPPSLRALRANPVGANGALPALPSLRLGRIGAAASGPRSALLLSGLLAGMGVLHFALPRPFDAMIPPVLPGTPRAWTQVSGVAELAVAAAVAVPATRRRGALAAAGLFVAVFPANVQMAYNWRHASAPKRAFAFARLPLQAPLLGWAFAVSGGAVSDGRPTERR